MKFIKDILLFQVETTGPDPEKDSIIHLAAVLLDKDNLLEKAFFSSYVRVSLLDKTIEEHSQQLNIPFDTMRKSPKIYDAIKKFSTTFGNEPLLATHNMNSVLFLRYAYKKAALSFDFDAHVLELWTLGYIYTLHYGIKKMPTFTTFLDQFNLKMRRRHNALEKARLAADMFKKIIVGI